MKVFSVVFVLVSLSLTSAIQCPVPPRFWCNTEAVAKQCGVLEQCKSRLYPQNSSEAEAVNVEVYFESYCPDSQNFIINQLYPTYMKLNSSAIMEPRLISFGKATYTPTSGGLHSFKCQHGQRECQGNMIQNCIIKYSNNNYHMHLPIIECMMRGPFPNQVAEKCVTDGGMDWKPIENCAYGDEGNMLLYHAGNETLSLNPVLNWVPWIVLNGVHTNQIQMEGSSDLMKLVCDTYQGTIPTACKSSSNRLFGSPFSLFTIAFFSICLSG